MEIILRCTYPHEHTHLRNCDMALLLQKPEQLLPEGYGLYLLPSEYLARFTDSDNDIAPIPDNAQPGSFILYDNTSKSTRVLQTGDIPDRTIFITGTCNSNCIMCPYTEYYRKRAENEPVDRLKRFVELMDPFSEYLCITGGEPTLLQDGFLDLLDTAKKHFKGTLIHILTNGRTFSYQSFVAAYQTVRPYKTLLGIPLHASSRELHDHITQSPGSFQQTISGLDNLHRLGEHIEIRIVTSALNKENLPSLAKLIADRFPNVRHVCFMGLEMMGNSMVNRDAVWCSFKELMPWVLQATDILLQHAIPVQLYNYPLCAVDRKYHSLYRKSISPWKVVYLPACDGCRYKEECGGFFMTTAAMHDIEVLPF